jgi:hypothetical protein
MRQLRLDSSDAVLILDILLGLGLILDLWVNAGPGVFFFCLLFLLVLCIGYQRLGSK